MSEYESIQVDDRESGVTVITLNREKKKNALNNQLLIELNAAFSRFDADDKRRIAVLTGAGNDAFSAGADLKDFPDQLWRGIPNVGIRTDKPIIAAVSGWCIGGALVMAMMCDIIVASESTKFYYPEALVGFTGGLISGLVNRLPYHVTMEMLLRCQKLDAERAYQLGFVNQVVPVGKQVEASIAMAEEMAAMAPLVQRTLKRFINDEIVQRGPSERMHRTRYALECIDNSDDAREGLAAFTEKRKPVFTGI